MIAQDKENGLGTDINVVVQPRDPDRFDIPGNENGRNVLIPEEDVSGDMDAVQAKKRISPPVSIESRRPRP